MKKFTSFLAIILSIFLITDYVNGIILDGSTKEIRELFVEEKLGARTDSVINEFSDLADVPASYSGEGGNCVKVNGGETALEYSACGVSFTATGTLLDLTGSVFSVNEGTLTNNKLCTYVSGTGIQCNSDDANTTYAATGTLLDLTGTNFSVNEGTLTDTKACIYSSGTGLVCNSTYLTGNETITLSGDVTGSGATAITATVGDDSHNHTSTTISGLDISADTNLTAGRSLTLTDDSVAADAELYTKTYNTALYNSGGLGTSTAKVQIEAPGAFTITQVACSTDTGTVTIQLDERTNTTPNTSGADVMTSQLVCDSDRQSTSSFDNAAIASGALISLDVDATASTPTTFRLHIKGTYDD